MPVAVSCMGQMAGTNRIYYLDNLKAFLIVLVVVHHATMAYAPTGGVWFYAFPGERIMELRYLLLFNASFFMGLFFFISGYFLPASFDRHGARRFVIDKLVRFGIPLVVAALVIIPLATYVQHVNYVGRIGFTDFYLRYWLGWTANAADRVEFNFAHMWFVEHLLVYAVLYAAIKGALRAFPRAGLPVAAPRARLYALLLFILALGAATHVMRISWEFPINRWVRLLGFIQMEPAHMPQYLSLFVLGIFAQRLGLLESLATPRNMLWFAPALAVYVGTFTAHGPARGTLWEFKEAVLCVGLCIGFLALFKTLFNRTGRVWRFLSENAYGVYILHMPVVVGLQYAFDPVRTDALTLFVIVSVLAVPGSFLASFLVRLIPGVKRVV